MRAARIGAALRYAWAFPATALGLCVGLPAWLTGGRAAVSRGVLEITGGPVARLLLLEPQGSAYTAITLGHVIVSLSGEALDDCRDHEHVHVRQYERWGALFFPLYFGSSLYEWARGGEPYWDNHFEREARALSRLDR
jgi:hypothetical protein